MKKKVLTIFLFALSVTAYCQKEQNNIIGQYKGIDPLFTPSITLHADSTFEYLLNWDNVAPFSRNTFRCQGNWTLSGNVITLNPGLKKREARVLFIEKEIEGKGSISIKFNYQWEEYDNEVLVKTTPVDVERMTLFINEKTYVNIVHEPMLNICSFARKVKNQVLLDSSHTIKLEKIKIERLAINTYGLNKKEELKLTNPNANYYEITIVIPVDSDRRPRGEQVVRKGKSLYSVDKYSFLPVDGLKKVK
jgi:hypothetical protein